MALIKCKECGHEVSDKALECPNCGCPIEKDIVCEECGEHLEKGVSNCPKCGCPVETSAILNDNTPEEEKSYVEYKTYKKKRNVLPLILLIVAIILVVFISVIVLSNNSSKTVKDSLISMVEEKTIPEKLQESHDIKEISNLINGTTWHYTEDLSTSKIGGWVKVEFKNGQFITYYAAPQDGKWTEGGRGNYKVSEGRYTNTGGKYYSVFWEGKMKFDWLELPCEMAMTIDNNGFQLHVSSSVMKAMNAVTMGVTDAAYYNATHNQVYSGKMEFGDYNWE